MKVIATNKAPVAIGPYSQAIRTSQLIYLSGQLPINPKSNLIESEDVQDQTKQIMENIKAILSEVGLDLSSIVKTTIFVCDISKFDEINEVYSSYMGQSRPARSMVEVSKLPKDAMVEIEAIASNE